MIAPDLAYARCEQITRHEARNFAYGIRLLPDEKRRAMSALYAFARRVDDIGDGAAAVEVKLGRLAETRTLLARVVGNDPPPDDPVLIALADAVIRFPIPIAALDEVVAGCEMDCSTLRYASFEELARYCRLVAGSIGRLSLGVFGPRDAERAPALADTLGLALQLTNILRDIVEDRDVMGRVYLPEEDLVRFGCAPDASGPNDALVELVRFECARARDLYGQGLELLGLLDRRSRACVSAMAGIYFRLLGRIESEPLAVFDHRVSVPTWEKLAVAAEAWRVSGEQHRRTPCRGRRRRTGGAFLRARGARRRRHCDAARSTAAPWWRDTWSFRRHGLTFDNGQHVYLRCCTAYRRFLERVCTAEDAPLQEHLDLTVLRPRPGRSAAVAQLRERALPAPLQLAPALLSYRHLGLVQRLGLGRAALALLRACTTDAGLDNESFGSFLARYGQHGDATRALFELIALPTTNVHLDEASAALVTKVFRTGLLGEPGASAIGWARIPLGALHGDAAERVLTAGGTVVRRRAKVAAIDVDTAADGAVRTTGVVVDGEHLDADAVVVAVPHDDAAALLPAEVAFGSSLVGLGTSPIIDVHLVFDRRITEHAVAAGVDTPVQFLFDRTAASGLEGPGQCLAISVSGADAEHGMRSVDLVERYHQAIIELFPAARDAELLDAVVSREHTATFRGLPGTAGLRPGAATGVDRLFLAGAWTDTGWPATMEGAVRSGTKAAWHALRAVGLAASPSLSDNGVEAAA